MRHIIFECSAHEANRFKNLKEGTMQKKIIAAAVIAMMMIAGVAMVSDDSDANTPVSGTTTVYAGDTVGENILLKYNESAYDHYEIGVTIKVQSFTIEQSDITYQDGADLVNDTDRTITDFNKLTYKLSQPAGSDNKYEGNYWLNITAASDATADDYYLYVQYQVTLKISEDISIPVDPVESCFKIMVSAPETVDITVVDGYSLTGTVGENFTSYLKVLKNGTTQFTNPIVWYADLPDGLAITPDSGKITGIPKEATKGEEGSVEAQSFKVYVTDTVTGVVYVDEITITINESTGEADGSLAIKVSGMSNNNQPVNNSYYVEQGTENVIFSVTATNAVITAVKVVNDDGTVTPVVPTNGLVTDEALNTDGTGRYMIYAEGISNNGQYVSTYVFVEVYAQTLDVTAEIIGSSS